MYSDNFYKILVENRFFSKQNIPTMVPLPILLLVPATSPIPQMSPLPPFTFLKRANIQKMTTKRTRQDTIRQGESSSKVTKRRKKDQEQARTGLPR